MRTSWTDTTSYGEWNAYEGTTFMGGIGVFGGDYVRADWRNAFVMTAARNNLGALIFRTRTSNAYQERMIITNDGNVGIGTMTPTAKLTIDGANGTISSTYSGATDKLIVMSSGNGVIQVTTPNTASGGIYFSDPESRDPGGVTYSHLTDSMQLRVNNATRMTINSSGDVGIGTSPAAKLDVNGTVTMHASTETISNYTNSTASYTIPDASINIRRITVNANTTINLPAFTSVAPKVYTLTVFVKQDAVGNRSVNFAGNGTDVIKWDSGVAPLTSTGASKITILQFTKPSDEGVWYGSKVWQED